MKYLFIPALSILLSVTAYSQETNIVLKDGHYVVIMDLFNYTEGDTEICSEDISFSDATFTDGTVKIKKLYSEIPTIGYKFKKTTCPNSITHLSGRFNPQLTNGIKTTEVLEEHIVQNVYGILESIIYVEYYCEKVNGDTPSPTSN